MSSRVLAVIDMQNDFISGALGSPEAEAIVPKVCEKIKAFDGQVLLTRDTHGENYLDTAEGKKLPVPHCIRNTWGWELEDRIKALQQAEPIDKETFGSKALGDLLKVQNAQAGGLGEIVLVGLCTDICVISNALLLKAYLPEVKITVDASCCAGVTPESHQTALEAMRACQIEIE